LENLKPEYQEVFVVRSSQKNSKFAKAVKSVLNSSKFKKAIANSKFKDFQKPNTWN
jgi:D-methionine transport system substrate-binding protein